MKKHASSSGCLAFAASACLCALLAFAGPATAQPYGYTDAWSEEEETFEQSPSGEFYAFGLTEGDYGVAVEVRTEVYSPSGASMAFDYAQGWGSVSANATAYVPENGEDGEHEVRSDHYADVGQGWPTWFLVTNLFVGVHSYYSRYYYNNSFEQYRAWYCGNSCQRQTLSAFVIPEPRSPYLQAAGKRIRILFWQYCRMGIWRWYDPNTLRCVPAM